MDLNEYTQRLNELATQASERIADEIFIPAANQLLAEIKQHVNDGENSAGGTIGNYDNKPAYYGKEAFVRKSSFTPKGKTGESVFKNGKPHKTEYFPSGYSGLRAKQGRKTDKINENYSGSTLLAYQMQAKEKEVVLGFTTKLSSDIRKGQEKRFGKIFYAQQGEMERYSQNVLEGVKIITDRIMLK